MAEVDIARITTGSLIAADKVNGTTVYNPNGEKLGEIEDIMIDKASGRAIYAIMSFGGFLGIGEKHHPIPWSTLKYDRQLEGYVVDMTREQLEGAPAYDTDELDWTPDYGRRVDQYYKAPSYWM